MFRRLVFAALPLSAFLAVPAHAAPQVEVGLTVNWNELGEGLVVVAECDAVANGDGWIPALTSVTCSINAVSQTTSLPGTTAVAAVGNATSAEVIMACVSGSAIFTNGSDILTVTASGRCQQVR